MRGLSSAYVRFLPRSLHARPLIHSWEPHAINASLVASCSFHFPAHPCTSTDDVVPVLFGPCDVCVREHFDDFFATKSTHTHGLVLSNAIRSQPGGAGTDGNTRWWFSTTTSTRLRGVSEPKECWCLVMCGFVVVEQQCGSGQREREPNLSMT